VRTSRYEQPAQVHVFGEHRQVTSDQPEQALLERIRALDLLLDVGDDAFVEGAHHVVEQVLLVGEMAIDGAVGNSGQPRDVGYRGRLVTFFREDRARGLQNRGPATLFSTLAKGNRSPPAAPVR
jgi:hypothetical protein